MKKLVSVALGAVAFAGCISAPFQPPTGMVAISKAPLSTEGNWKAGKRCGSASVQSVLGLYSWGDCSATAAAEAGGLSRIDYLDYEYTNIIGIWQKVVVHAYGE